MDDIRVRRPDRDQLLMRPVYWEGSWLADHVARAIWAIVVRLDLSAFRNRSRPAVSMLAGPRLSHGCCWFCGGTRRRREWTAVASWRAFVSITMRAAGFVVTYR